MLTMTVVDRPVDGRTAPATAPTARPAGVTAATVVVLVPVLIAATIAGHVVNGDTPVTSWWYGNIALSAVLLVPGALIAWRQPRNAIGPIMCAACVAEAACGAGREYLVLGIRTGDAPGAIWVGWFSDSLYIVGVAALPLMLMLLPDGRPLGRRSRVLLALPVVALVIGMVADLFSPDSTVVAGHRLTNPAGHALPAGIPALCSVIGLGLLLVTLVAAVALLVIRFRRSRGEQRLQLKWVVWGGAIELVEVGTEFVPGNTAGPYLSIVATGVFATTIGVAILRHRMFDIDLVINRTLVFGALTALVIGGYVAVVLAVDAALGTSADLGPGLAATAVVALAFSPARARLQGWVDRLMYGDGRNPYGVMTRLGRRLETDDGTGELAVVVDTVSQALRLPYAAIVGPDGAVLAETGTASAAVLQQPMTYQGAAMGQLLVQPRRGAGGRFDGREQQLLDDLARQVGAAVHAVRLSSDLQASRARLVTAKEEERRRLRRDLHDGLGPKLAALGLKLDAAHALADTDPARSKAVLGAVRDDIRTTIGDVRRLVYGLRPPALDELGLVAALRECAGRFDTTPDATAVTVTAPQGLPPLPAAVEVAAYWITNEAITNVVRHAGARHCTVEIRVVETPHRTLVLVVRDDGRGLRTGWRAGVGTASMAERAAELGGTATIGARPDGPGTEVRAVIPCEGSP